VAADRAGKVPRGKLGQDSHDLNAPSTPILSATTVDSLGR
jgi:hypothetical protein